MLSIIRSWKSQVPPARKHFLKIRMRCLAGILLIFGCTTPSFSGDDRAVLGSLNADSELASFPNSATTLPGGTWSIEWSTLSYTDGSKVTAPMGSSDVLVRYGIVDPLEFRIYTQGITAQWGSNPAVGFSPLTFDVKARILEPVEDYPWIPALAFESALQTQLLGSAPFNSGTEPTFTLNVDQPLGQFLFQYNLGTMRYMSPCKANQMDWNLTYSWSIEHDVTDAVTLFIDGFYGGSVLPKVTTMSDVTTGACITSGTPTNGQGKNGHLFGENMVGGGLFWNVTPGFGTYINVAGGTNSDSPGFMSYIGFLFTPGAYDEDLQ